MYTGALQGKAASRKNFGFRKRFKAAGGIAVAAAAAATVAGASSARADLSGFSSFAPINTAGLPAGDTAIGYSTDGTTFNLTDANNGESVSGFTSSEVTIPTSFVVNFTLTGSGSADGMAFVLQSQGNNALGGGGGDVGYVGIGNSAGIQLEGYGNSGGASVGGAVPNKSGVGGNIFSGNPINYTLTYVSDPTTHIGSFSLQGVDSVNPSNSISTGGSQINLQAAIGGTSAYIGFTGATGGLNATQSITNFKFTNTSALNLNYSPIAFQASTGAGTGFNQDMVIEKGAPQIGATANITASMDQGTDNKANNVWYEQGYDTSALSTGLPPSGARFTSQADSVHVFQMQNYSGNNAVLVGTNGGSGSTLTLTNPQAFSALSILSATGNGADNIDLTIHYADSAAATTITHVVSPDWFNGGAIAWDANGRVVPSATGSSSFNNVNNGVPSIFQSDVMLPDTTDPISSIQITSDGGNGRTAVFAISGSVTVLGTLVYTGVDPSNASNDGKWDVLASKTFNSSAGATVFTNGQAVVFDDTAATAYHTVTIGSAGVLPSGVTFNNNASSYTLAAAGGPIVGGGGLTLNGTGTVTILNTNTFTGETTINAGTLVIGSGGSIASGNILVQPGGTFTIAAGGQPTATPIGVIDNGTVNFNTTSQTIGGLTGGGVVNLNGTALTAGIGTNFNGSFGGTGGSIAYDSGTITVNSSNLNALAGLTAGITVGLTNSSSAQLVINDNSGSAGAGITVTLGPGGTLTSPASTNGSFAGNIVLASNNTVPAVITGGSYNASGNTTTFTVSGNISGSSLSPVSFASGNASTVILTGHNTYSGETRLQSTDSSTLDTYYLVAGGTNVFSPNSGINLVGGGSAIAVVDINGFNQSVAYLSGATPTNIFKNNGLGATLTINNGNTASGSFSTFNSTLAEGGNGPLILVKSGTGTQILSAANSYSGGTNIAGGTLVAANPVALGYGAVSMSGGTLSLASPAAISSSPVLSGFNSTGYQLNSGNASVGVASLSADNQTVNLTNGAGGEATSIFTKTPIALNSTGFIASFNYQASSGADGVTFTLQNDPRGSMAIGGSGGALAVGGANGGTNITNAGSVELNIYTGAAGGIGTAFGTNGNVPTFNTTLPASNLSDGTLHQVTVAYNAMAQTVTEYIFNGGSTPAYSVVYPNVNFSTILNGSSGYVGFTGATGGVTSTQNVSGFTFGALTFDPVSITNPVNVYQSSTPSVLSLASAGTFTLTSIGNLTVNPAAVLKLTDSGTGTKPVGVLSTPQVTFNTGSGSTYTGQLDIGKNDLDITNSSLSVVTAYVQTGLNLTGGAKWNGPGITSSAAAGDTSHLTAVGVIANNSNGGSQLYGSGNTLGLFDGSNPGYNDILVKYTYFGDANLDGKVDGSDYSLIDGGYASHGSLTGWYNGDFNYDGVIDGSDYALIDNAFNNQGSPQVASLNALVATSTSQVAGPSAAVPEPASIAAVAAVAMVMSTRRRRR